MYCDNLRFSCSPQLRVGTNEQLPHIVLVRNLFQVTVSSSYIQAPTSPATVCIRDTRIDTLRRYTEVWRFEMVHDDVYTHRYDSAHSSQTSLFYAYFNALDWALYSNTKCVTCIPFDHKIKLFLSTCRLFTLMIVMMGQKLIMIQLIKSAMRRVVHLLLFETSLVSDCKVLK